MNALFVSEQNPMNIALFLGLQTVLKRRSGGGCKTTAKKHLELLEQECPADIDVVVIDVNPRQVRDAVQKIRSSHPAMLIIGFTRQPVIAGDLDKIGVKPLVPEEHQERNQPFYEEFFEKHVPEPAETAA